MANLTLKLTFWPWRWHGTMKIISAIDFLVKSTWKKEVFHLSLGKLVRNIIFDLENHIFAYLTLTFTFWPWGWPLIIKIVPQLNSSVKKTYCTCCYFHLLKITFHSFDLRIDLSTLKMTLNQQNIIRNKWCSQLTPKRVNIFVPNYVC